MIKNESTTVAGLDTTPNIQAITYNDFTGFMGNDFPAVTTKTNMFSDDILKNMLTRLEKSGKYSKDIQNITVDDVYKKEMDNWRAWLKYNIKNQKKIDKSLYFKYIDLFPEIEKMRREKMTESLLRKLELFINEDITNRQFSDIVKYLNGITADINKFRKNVLVYSGDMTVMNSVRRRYYYYIFCIRWSKWSFLKERFKSHCIVY